MQRAIPLASAVAVLAALVPLAPAAAAASTSCVRLAGADRVATAAAVSRHGWDATDTVVVTTRGAYPDALAASPLAAHREAPVLYTDRDALPAVTVAELERLQPREVVIVGGEAAVSAAVAEDLRAHAASVVRLAGADRYETAAIVATASDLPAGEAVVLAVGDHAAAAAGPAATGRLPLLLATESVLPAATRTALAALGTSQAIVVGATPEVTAALGRLGIESVLPGTATEPTSLIAAASAADTLAAAPLAAKTGAALVMVERDRVPEPVSALLAAGAICTGVVGGTAAVSDAVATALATVPVESGPVVVWRTPDGSEFRTRGHSDEEYTRIRAAIAAGEQVGIPNGRIVRGDGGYNVGHDWHLVDVEFADMAIEVCDGNASDLDEDLDYWVDIVQRYCPWDATPIAIEEEMGI